MPDYRIVQDKMVVAAASGPNAGFEILRYADGYRYEGSVTIQHKNKEGKWRRWAWFCRWPEEEQ